MIVHQCTKLYNKDTYAPDNRGNNRINKKQDTFRFKYKKKEYNLERFKKEHQG